MTTLDKNEAGRLIPLFRDAVKEEAAAIDRKNSLLILSCIDDAYDSLGNEILKGLVHPHLRHPETPEIEQFAAFDWVMENFLIIEDAFRYLLENTSTKARTVSNLPEITIAISGLGPEVFLDELKHIGKLGPRDFTLVATPMLMNTFEVTQVIIVKEMKDSEVKMTVEKVLNLLLSIRRLRMAEVAVRFGLTLTLEEGQPIPHVDYPKEFTPGKIGQIDSSSPRLLLDSAHSVSDWASDLKRASAKALLTIGEGLDSRSNQAALERETREFVSAYSLFTGYEDSFRRTYGYSLGDFVKACEALVQLSRPCFHTVYRKHWVELVQEVRAITRLSNSNVNRILASLTWRNGLRPHAWPLMPAGSERIFNMRRAMAGLLSRLDDHFTGPQYSDQIGKLFETRCRDVLKSEGFDVYPNRLGVPEGYLPPEISLRLWQHIKTSTDIDILTRRNAFLFVIECKERKRAGRRRARLEQLFHRIEVDLLYKTKWVRDNPGAVSKLLGSEWAARLLCWEPGLWLVPIIVSNYPVDTRERLEVANITYDELSRLGKGVERVTIERLAEEDTISLSNVAREPLTTVVFKSTHQEP